MLLVLRVFSEMASILLAATLAAVFERLQCTLASRSSDGGITLTDYLALEVGTSVSGLLGMVLGKGISKITTRTWSAVRLVSVAMIPLLNILIMGESSLLIYSVFYLLSLANRHVAPYSSN